MTGPILCRLLAGILILAFPLVIVTAALVTLAKLATIAGPPRSL